MLFGAFNGILVAGFKIQPMVATLILYTAGRSIAAWINNNELPVISDPSFGYFGGFIPGIPIQTPFFIAVACMIVMGLVMKFTSLGLYTQAVGINAVSYTHLDVYKRQSGNLPEVHLCPAGHAASPGSAKVRNAYPQERSHRCGYGRWRADAG